MAKKKTITEIEKLDSFKKRSGWSYQKISNHMKIHPQTIYNWLNGKHAPSDIAMDRLRKFLRVYAY
ncbi:hypothetical protein ES703_18269 [subsurface metagenome]